MRREFRSQLKARVGLYLPVKLAKRFRLEAKAAGRSESELGSTYLCQGLGINPEEFGINNQRKDMR